MGSSVTKYLEKLNEKVNNAGHFGANAKELEKVMSDREIMNAKKGKTDEIDVIYILKNNILNYQKNSRKYKRNSMKCLLVNIWIMG